MRSRILLCGALAVTMLAACTTGQSNTTPNVVAAPANGKLQMAVGTVNFANIGIGINVLETYRGPNGFTAVPINTATLVGPAGFSAPAGSGDPGSGQAAIPLGSAHNQFVIGNAGANTQLASADGFGVGPPSASTTGMNVYPMQPQFADAALPPMAFPAAPIYGGPPAYPAVLYVPSALSSLVQIPSGWSEGFYIVALTAPPPSGTYMLNVTYTANGSTLSTQASAVLPSPPVTLPFLNPPQIQSTHDGGATISLLLPPGVPHALVNVIDLNVPPSTPPAGAPCTTGLSFATVAFTQSGQQAIPPNIGRGGAPSFCSGDTLVAQAYGFDYDDFALGPPGNTLQTPSLPPRADLTVSFPSPGQE
jgi:hypothetical protein